MIELKRQFQTDENFKIIDRIAYVRDYCTIRLNAGRQVGHSTAVINLAEHYSLQNKKVLVLAPNLQSLNSLKKKASKTFDLNKNIYFCSIYDINNLNSIRADIVIFDLFDYSYMSNKQSSSLDDLLNMVGSGKKDFIAVLLN